METPQKQILQKSPIQEIFKLNWKYINFHTFLAARDLLQVSLVDRLMPSRRWEANKAINEVRLARFNARSKVRHLPWPDLLRKLNVTSVGNVAIPDPVLHVEGVGYKEYYFAIGAIAKALNPRTIFEFGTYRGLSALGMAMNTSPECRIYTVDLPDDVNLDASAVLKEDKQFIQSARHRVGEAFLNSPYKDRIKQIRADSTTYRAEKDVSNVDLVFIDGCHETPLVEKDTENAFRILSPTGTIMWDDYIGPLPAVVKCVDALADRYPIYRIPETGIAIYSRRFDKSNLKR